MKLDHVEGIAVEIPLTKKRKLAQHLLSAIPHGTYAECFADPERDPVWQAMWTTRPRIKDGWLEVPKAPGFGIELDEAMVRRFRMT